MRKKIFAGAIACALGLMLNVSATETAAPTAVYDSYNGTLTVSGTAEEGSFVTFQILSLGSDYEDLKGSEREAAVFYCAQEIAGEDGYSFGMDFTGESGSYKAFVVDSAGDARYEFEIPLVKSSDYTDAIAELNAGAKTGSEAFAEVVSENSFVLGFDYSVEATEEALENFCDYVKKNPLDASENAENTQLYRSFVLMSALEDGNVEGITDYIDDIYFESETLRDEISALIGVNAKAGSYMAEKLSGASMSSLDELNEQLRISYILGAVRYSKGYGTVVSALESYGSEVGITGTISSKACQQMLGNDYDADEVDDAYRGYAGSNSGSNGGGVSGGSGGGSSANKTAPSASGVSGSIGSGTPSVKAEDTTMYSDLPESHWAAESVGYLSEKGIVNGVGDGTFEPDRAITREEFTKMLVLICGFDTDTKASFDDCESGAWYIPYIGTAAENGVVKGMGENLFGIGQNITRQDMAVMVNRALDACGVALDNVREYAVFADEANISDYAADGVRTLFEGGVINGKGDNIFDPLGNATRAEAAKMIYEAFKGGAAE